MKTGAKQIAQTVFYATFKLNFTSSTTQLRGIHTHISEKNIFPSCLFMLSTGTPLLSK